MTITRGAHTGFKFTVEHRSDSDSQNSRVFDRPSGPIPNLIACEDQDFTCVRIDDVRAGNAVSNATCETLDDISVSPYLLGIDATCRPTVFGANDDVIRRVD